MHWALEPGLKDNNPAMKNLHLKDLLLEIPTQVSNPTGSLTDIKGLLVQVRTLRLTSYIFRSCRGTEYSGEEKGFFILSFCLLLPLNVSVTASSLAIAFPAILPSHSFPSFAFLNPSHLAHSFLLYGSRSILGSYLHLLHIILFISFHGLACFFISPTFLVMSSFRLHNSASHFTFLKSPPEGLTA